MTYTKELLLLHLSQAEQSLEKAKNNSYSDHKKEDYHERLAALFVKVKADVVTNIQSFTDQQIYDGPSKYLSFIFKSLEFLDSSTLNQIPYEIVACLDIAMKESLNPSDQYILVTSLINNVLGFSYDGSIAFDNGLYSDVETRYGITFPNRLVQINLPKAFSRDYLAAAVLYHELGHFIDRRFSLMNALTLSLLNELSKGNIPVDQQRELAIYFPYMPINSQAVVNQMYVHFMEYFCDLFAAQYIGEASNYYVRYITSNQNKHSSTHPSTLNRVKVVEDYLNGQPNFIVNLINQALTSIRKVTLTKKFQNVEKADFFNLVPPIVESPEELHGLINVAWDLWLNDQKDLSNNLNTKDSVKVYRVINNLVEKSIGNFITINKWNQALNQLTPST